MNKTNKSKPLITPKIVLITWYHKSICNGADKLYSLVQFTIWSLHWPVSRQWRVQIASVLCWCPHPAVTLSPSLLSQPSWGGSGVLHPTTKHHIQYEKFLDQTQTATVCWYCQGTLFWSNSDKIFHVTLISNYILMQCDPLLFWVLSYGHTTWTLHLFQTNWNPENRFELYTILWHHLPLYSNKKYASGVLMVM